MKLLILSDIHGSSYYAEKIKEIKQREKPDKIILLGDLYYHGPRNPLSKEYDPAKVAGILNTWKEEIVAVRGNCDAQVDEMISEFKMENYVEMEIGKKKIFFTHGHEYNMERFPNVEFDIMVYGHFHTGFIKEKESKIFFNPGSISLPKNNTEHSYGMIEDKQITLKDIDGTIIEKVEVK